MSWANVVVEGLSDVVLVIDRRNSLILNICCNLKNSSLSVNTTGAASRRGSHINNVEPKCLNRVVEVRDFSISMEAEHTRNCEHRNVVNELKLLLKGGLIRNDIVGTGPGEEESLILIKDEVSKILSQIGVKDSTIKVISDSSTVHGLTNKISESIPR